MTHKILLSITVLLLAYTSVSGQHKTARDMIRERKGILRLSEWAGLLSIHTNGVALGYRKSNIEKYYLNTFYQYEMANIRHPREVSRSVDPAGNRRSVYAYGKQNTLLVLRASKGRVKYYSEKARTGNVGIGSSYLWGITLGLLKPYYLTVRKGHDDRAESTYIKYSNETADVFLDPVQIRRAAPFFTGIKETKLIPGAHAQASLHLTFRGNTPLVLDMEVGAKGDLFVRNIPIMVTEQNRPFFVSLFVSLHIGKRK